MDLVAVAGWEARASALTDRLIELGVLVDPGWIKAFKDVPRHVFVPEVLRGGGVISASDPEWLDLVYSDETLRTQTIAAGEGIGRHEIPTSSSSRPRVMAAMLARLGARPGHRVLEIGTGTGYNTGLLGHFLGPDHVASIDIDPGLIETARHYLAAIGQHPHLTAGDGAEGWPEHGPYDRIIATCAVTSIPPAWIDQLADGGTIVAPFDAGEAGPLLVLTKTKPGEVTGRIDPYPAHFMPLRQRADSPLGPGQTTGFTEPGIPAYGTTTLNPKDVVDVEGTDLALFLWLHAPGLRLASAPGRVFVHTDTALAQADLEPVEPGRWPVQQRGTMRLWDTVEHAYRSWLDLGRPDPSRFGVSAPRDEDQFVWLDNPDSLYSWPLPVPSPL
ncbi:methyltransferase domain-containing protein [Amycolatopsis minnesotensis]|uniref:Protein-L-isoaspartate O-methyltransferase n=1 Tax=Amycolatopsis minnesotensis TaxID=337894 RepID=A0ABP5CER0_9PSEU